MVSPALSSRAAVRSVASVTRSSPAVARAAVAFVPRTPASLSSRRALCSNTRSLQQFPRLQSFNNLSKRTFATTGRMVCAPCAWRSSEEQREKYWECHC